MKMKKVLFTMVAMAVGVLSAHAIDDTTVEIVYSGTTATVTVASNISSYVTVNSGTSSHVQLTQSSSFDPTAFKTTTNTTGEITYILSGSTTDGEFYLTAPSKCTIQLAGLTLTNAMKVYSGAAISVYGGKRIKLSAKKETTNTLTATSTSTYNGGIYCKGHLELQGNGVLNISDSYAHAIKAKEYVQVKNLTLNITSAAKDGINCGEYFWMKSGTVTLTGIGSDGIETSLKGTTSTGEIVADETTGVEAHDDEDSGNFYQDGGTLTITLSDSNTTGSMIQVAGTETHSGGTYNGTDYTGIKSTLIMPENTLPTIYDLDGRQLPANGVRTKGVYIINTNGKTIKTFIK